MFKQARIKHNDIDRKSVSNSIANDIHITLSYAIFFPCNLELKTNSGKREIKNKSARKGTVVFWFSYHFFVFSLFLYVTPRVKRKKHTKSKPRCMLTSSQT